MDIGAGSLCNLARLRDFKRQRLSSWDRAGGNRDCLVIAPGETARLGEIEGAGCVKHWWVTLASFPPNPHELCTAVLRMYWDGESSPSVEVPVGDFFGMGFGRRRNFVSLPLQMSPEDGKSFNCWFPMPFARGARFELENQGEARCSSTSTSTTRPTPPSTPRSPASTRSGTGATRPPASRSRRGGRGATTASTTSARSGPGSPSPGPGTSPTSPAPTTT